MAPAHSAAQWLWAWPFAVAGTWLLAWAYLWLVRRFPTSLPGRRPIACLLGLFVATLVASQAPLVGLPWLLAAATSLAMGSYFWFFAYWIAENHSPDNKLSPLSVGAWRPFWGFTNVPYGKGCAYLSRVEARDDQQLLESQLSGLKLLLRATILALVLHLAVQLQHSRLGWMLPTYPEALDAMKAGSPLTLPLRWIALVVSFLFGVTGLAISGHQVIAICRMAGFNAFRNTYRPFESTSIAEFYNRIYWYFKELLATFFFYPTYLRYFKSYPRLRLFAATFAAAGLGNFIYHFLRDYGYVYRFGLFEALRLYSSYAIYSLILGAAIALSQLRILSRKGRPEPGGLRRYAAIGGVLTFYFLISIIEEPNLKHSLGDYGHYFISLFRP
jgi:hypothetical protein